MACGDEAELRVCGAEDLRRWCAEHGHMAPCVVKALAEGSASYACGGISPGDILLSVDGVPVRKCLLETCAAGQQRRRCIPFGTARATRALTDWCAGARHVGR
jgi:sarcosine oxidase gamma subunit